jgi:hypothetical protein
VERNRRVATATIKLEHVVTGHLRALNENYKVHSGEVRHVRNERGE